MENNLQRIFPPVSKWIYYKIYIGKNLAEDLLKELHKKSNELVNKGFAKRWFFIRYSDPNFHIRFRICCHLESRIFVLDEINTLISEWLSARIIHNVVIDSYHRELERYGANTIEYVEELFHIDSDIILRLINIEMRRGYNMEEFRIISSIVLIEAYFKAFDVLMLDIELILSMLQSNMYKEFGFNDYNRKSLNQLYRRYKHLVIASFTDGNDNRVSSIREEVSKYYEGLGSVAKKIANSEDAIESFVEYSLPNYIHMMMNRLWADKNRIYELIIYDFLARYYKSIIARKQLNE